MAKKMHDIQCPITSTERFGQSRIRCSSSKYSVETAEPCFTRRVDSVSWKGENVINNVNQSSIIEDILRLHLAVGLL